MKKLKRPLSLAAAAVLCAALLTGCLSSHAQEESSSGSDASGQQTAWSEPEADQEYDAEQGKLDKDQYGSTVLAETEDAGQEYLDETLFIGDSNTVRMMAYGHTTLSNTIGVISMGIQHVPTKKCVYFTDRSGAVSIPEAVAIMQPKRIVITFGTNNTIGWSSDVFASEYKEALEAITDAWPYADIIINAVPPVDKLRQNTGITMQTIDSFNQALAEMAEELGYKFLDSSEALKDEDTGFAKTDYTISDGVHLSKKGMQTLFDYVRTHSYETEDRRPKPLKTVPGRKETPPDIITEDPLAVRGSAGSMESSSDEDEDAHHTLHHTIDFSLLHTEKRNIVHLARLPQACGRIARPDVMGLGQEDEGYVLHSQAVLLQHSVKELTDGLVDLGRAVHLDCCRTTYGECVLHMANPPSTKSCKASASVATRMTTAPLRSVSSTGEKAKTCE